MGLGSSAALAAAAAAAAGADDPFAVAAAWTAIPRMRLRVSSVDWSPPTDVDGEARAAQLPLSEDWPSWSSCPIGALVTAEARAVLPDNALAATTPCSTWGGWASCWPGWPTRRC